jgi:succinylarginine dihydrolase
VNFDGLVGPTHTFGGLSYGNPASLDNKGRVSNPRASALQGLAKMQRLMGYGLFQAILPPHERPHIPTLRRLGFTGSDRDVLEKAWKCSNQLVANISSASSMWTANAATVSPSADTEDQIVHFTPANLGAMFHRALEVPFTTRLLELAFPDSARFAHHNPLPFAGRFGDEGAANHSRFCASIGEPGVEVFTYGKSAFDVARFRRKFEPRQALEASQAVARFHRLDLARIVFALQSAKAVKEGAFHNDVVMVANERVAFAHESAFEHGRKVWDEIRRACPFELCLIEVPESEVPLSTAIKTYLFNSQLVTLPGEDENMILLLPEEVKSNRRAWNYVQKLISVKTPISKVDFVDVRESMRNGGGPACLRLRVVLTAEERAAIGARLILDEGLLVQLKAWVGRRYRDSLSINDLADPSLLEESRRALDELTGILNLGSIYEFQSAP